MSVSVSKLPVFPLSHIDSLTLRLVSNSEKKIEKRNIPVVVVIYQCTSGGDGATMTGVTVVAAVVVVTVLPK